jgi:hypothetical protein
MTTSICSICSGTIQDNEERILRFDYTVYTGARKDSPRLYKGTHKYAPAHHHCFMNKWELTPRSKGIGLWSNN